MPYIHVSNLYHVIILYHITSCFYIIVFIPLKRAESPCSAFRASLSVIAGLTDPRNGRHSLTMAFTFRRQHINLVPRRQPKSLGGRDVARGARLEAETEDSTDGWMGSFLVPGIL